MLLLQKFHNTSMTRQRIQSRLKQHNSATRINKTKLKLEQHFSATIINKTKLKLKQLNSAPRRSRTDSIHVMPRHISLLLWLPSSSMILIKVIFITISCIQFFFFFLITQGISRLAQPKKPSALKARGTLDYGQPRTKSLGAHANPPIHKHRAKPWEVANEGKCRTQDLSTSSSTLRIEFLSMSEHVIPNLESMYEFYQSYLWGTPQLKHFNHAPNQGCMPNRHILF